MRSLRSSVTTRALLVLAALAPAACSDVIDTINAEDVAIAALIKTPDAKKPNSNEVIPGVVTFNMFFGKIDKSKIVTSATGKSLEEGAFTANKDALVSLDFTDPSKGPTTINVGKGSTDGMYSSTSSLDGRLAWIEGEYTLSISHSGRTFKMRVTTKNATGIQEFQTANEHVITDWDVAGHPNGFTATRVGGQDDVAKNDIAFVDVRDVSAPSTSAWTNFPSDPMGFLMLVVDDKPWRAKSFTVPQSAFKAQKGYVVTLTSVAQGEQDPNSAKLFLGSTFLAGVADGGALVTK